MSSSPQSASPTQQPNPASGWPLAIATFITIISTLAVNTWSNLNPPGGRNVGEIANTVLGGVLITPANYAFAIWGLIYVGLIAYGVYQLGATQRRDPQIRRVSGLLILAGIAQVIWIFLFTLQQFAWSILAMFGILISLILAYLTLSQASPKSRSRRWYACYPFSIYLAWISVATVINVASALHYAGWGGFGQTDSEWTALMIGVTAIIGAMVIWTRQDLPFTLIYLWAYGAIAARHSDLLLIWSSAIIASCGLIVVYLLRRWVMPPQLTP